MIVAIPVANNKLCVHFGHCEQFIFFEVDDVRKKVISEKVLVPPPHEPGIMPLWLSEQKANLVIVGGIGQRAQELLKNFNITVICGITIAEPRQIIANFLQNTLKIEQNICDH